MSNINEATVAPERYNDALGAAIKSHIGGAIATDKKKGEVAAICFTRKIPFTDLMAPTTAGSTATKESWAWLRQHVESGYPMPVQRALGTPSKARSEAQKSLVSTWKTKYTSYIARYRQSLEALYNPKKDERTKASRAPQMPKTGDKVVDEANAISMRAIKKETDLQNWHANNLGQITANEIGKLRAKIIALLQVPHTPVEPKH